MFKKFIIIPFCFGILGVSRVAEAGPKKQNGAELTSDNKLRKITIVNKNNLEENVFFSTAEDFCKNVIQGEEGVGNLADFWLLFERSNQNESETEGYKGQYKIKTINIMTLEENIFFSTPEDFYKDVTEDGHKEGLGNLADFWILLERSNQNGSELVDSEEQHKVAVQKLSDSALNDDNAQ